MFIPRNGISNQRPVAPSNPVPDMYGPGAFLAWMMTGLCVFVQYHSPTEGYLYWNIDKDLACFLLYPAVAAGQMIQEMSRLDDITRNCYPDGEWEVAIGRGRGPASGTLLWACANVCCVALGMNCLLLNLLRKSKARVVCLLAINVLILIALSHRWTLCPDIKELIEFIGLATFAPSIWTLAALLPLFSLFTLSITLQYPRSYHTLFPPRRNPSYPFYLNDTNALVVLILAPLVLCFGCAWAGICIYAMFWGDFPMFYLLLIPETSYGIGDFGQIMALVAAGINTVFAVRGLWAERGPMLWRLVLGIYPSDGEGIDYHRLLSMLFDRMREALRGQVV